MRTSVDERPHWVYVYSDAQGATIYVGCTVDRAARMENHSSQSPWWDVVADVDHYGPFPKREARDLETAMIGELQPPANVFCTDRDPRLAGNWPTALPVRELGRLIGTTGILHYAQPYGPAHAVSSCGRSIQLRTHMFESNEVASCKACIRSAAPRVSA